MDEKNFDVIIVGAGPIGLACGIEASKKNLKYMIFDIGNIVNSIYNYPINMTFFSSSDRLEIGDVPFVSINTKPARAEALEYYRRVKEHWKLNLTTYEKIIDIKKSEDAYEVISVKDRYKAKSVIIAIGFYSKPNLMNIPGEELPKVTHYYSQPHPYAFQKVLVIGGGNSAVDAALEVFRKGGDVTMVIMTETFDKGVKYWVKPDVENRIKEGSIKAYFSTKVKEIKEDYVVLETPGGEVIIENDFVLAMTGYHPDFEFLEKIGIDFTDDNKKEPVYDPGTYETNIKNIYLAGVVCGGENTSMLTIETSRSHAVDIIADISKKIED